MPILSHTPIVTAGGYHAGDCLGVPFELPVNSYFPGCRSKLESIVITDLAAQKAEIVFWFFNRKPSNGTYANNSEFDMHDSDMAYCIGKKVVAATDYSDSKDNSVATVTGFGLVCDAGASQYSEPYNIWVIAEIHGTPTYAAVSDLTFKFGFVTDQS